LKIVGAISSGSGSINEDGFGFVVSNNHVDAAWIFDGVTGINTRNYLPGGSDAAWFVLRANAHLQELAANTLSLRDILTQLVGRLIMEWRDIAPTLDIPPDYDPPAACLTLVKNYRGCWRGLRLGDSCLLANLAAGGRYSLIGSPNNEFDKWLSENTKKRRAAGMTDIKTLLAEFRPQLIAARKTRNTPGGYSILESSTAALNHVEFINLGAVSSVLLCTDGFYRAVDCYQLFSDQELFSRSLCEGGVDYVLQKIRNAEAEDPHCMKFKRFKPADDATALVLQVE